MAGLARYTGLLRQQFSMLTRRTVRPITHAWDSVVLEVNEEWMFRFPLRQQMQVSLQREIRLLPLLAATLAPPVPHFALSVGRRPAFPFPLWATQSSQEWPCSVSASLMDRWHPWYLPWPLSLTNSIVSHLLKQGRRVYRSIRQSSGERAISSVISLCKDRFFLCWMSSYVRGRHTCGKRFCQGSSMAIWQANIFSAIQSAPS
jgi:hypothetical protein